MRRRNTFLLVATVGLLAACAMHNRMFYLHRYAGEARRLEQEGRRFEANDYWGRASVKAESVLVHRRAGDDAAEAMAIRGEAMAALGQCEEALRVLGDALVQLRDSTEAEYAALAQARCYVQNGFPQQAAQSVQPVIESRDAARRTAARLIAGTAYRHLGQDSLALEMLAGNNSRDALLQRAIAEASMGRDEQANLVVDSLVARRDSTIPWDTVIVGVAARNPVEASRMLDKLAQSRVLPPERLPELLYADALRLGRADTMLQAARLAQILETYPMTDYGNRTRTEMALRKVRAARSMGDLTEPLDSLAAIAAGPGGEGADSASRFVRALVAVTDSVGPGMPYSDMRLFLAGEMARDRLTAPRLADSLFTAVVTGWPESPYAGKAWLASRHVRGDTTDAGGQFQANPYVLMLRGGDGNEYAQLEDSLAKFASSIASSIRPSAPAPGLRATPAPRVGRQQPGDSGARPAPRGGVRPGGRRLTEPQ